MNINIFAQDNIGKKSTLQGARFLFVLLIFLSHCSSPYITSPFDFGGECGVSFFFILSGFVLSLGYGPRVSRGEFRTRQFFWRHFMKL
ncbi:acyltransferase family protein [Hoylesella buccalis]|uniref:acyltransferase family protein n=1 Tax=Hoylesella buccalis TaxID=28127 RepID=UPI0035AC12D0